MATAREIALAVLPHFAKNVLAGSVCDYSYYAKAIGRNPAKEAIIVGDAMHAIGGTCVLCEAPVAPLHYVQRADGKWRGVFEADSIERSHVLPHYKLLYEAARVYAYTQSDFSRIERGLRDIIPEFLSPHNLGSPHDIWHVAVLNKLDDSTTPFQRALVAYQRIVDEERTKKA